MSDLIDKIISQKCRDDDFSMSNRIEIRLDKSLKNSANAAAVLSNKTLSEYIRDLIKTDCDRLFKKSGDGDIVLPGNVFDQFVEACESAGGPNDNICKLFKAVKNKQNNV